MALLWQMRRTGNWPCQRSAVVLCVKGIIAVWGLQAAAKKGIREVVVSRIFMALPAMGK